MHSTLVKCTLLYFAFYCLWSYIFTQTVFFPPASLYVAFSILLILFVLALNHAPVTKYAPIEGVVWIPFLIYTILGFVVSFDGENILYRIVCILLLLLASHKSIIDFFPRKFILWSGLFASLGIFIQLLLPSFYSSKILPLFVVNQEKIAGWMESGYGLTGFYYQLSHVAMNLILAEAVIIFFFRDLYDNKQERLLLKRRIKKRKGHLIIENRTSGRRHHLLFLFSLLIVFIALLLTGKRSFAIMAIVIPLLVYILRKKKIASVVVSLFMIALFIYLVIVFFVNNIALFSNSIFLHRLVETVEAIQYGIDFSSGREDLAASAISLFKEHPLFGIGVGRFVKVSHQYTDVHNTYLQVLCEQGLVGFILLVPPLIFCLLRTISFLRMHADGHYGPYLEFSLFIQLYFLLYSFTGNTMINYEVYFFYFLAIAILINVRTKCKTQRHIVHK